MPFAEFVKAEWAMWNRHVGGTIVPSTKELRYEDQVWQSERVALDLAPNHLPSDSGGTQFGVMFEVLNQGKYEWVSLAHLGQMPPPQNVRRAYIEDNGPRGYPADEIARENPTKRDDSDAVGEHGEGLIMGALSCVRRGVSLSYQSRDWSVDAVAFPRIHDKERPEKGHGWYLEYLLTHNVRIQGSRTIFESLTPDLVKELFKLKQNLLHYAPHQIVAQCHREISDKPGEERRLDGQVVQLLPEVGAKKSPQNRVYIKGVYSTYKPSKEELLFSYNLNLPTLRDRNFIPNFDDHVVRVFSRSCNAGMAKLIFDRTVREEDTCEWRAQRDGSFYGDDNSNCWEVAHLLPILQGDCPADLAVKFKQTFESQYGKDTVIGTCSHATELFRKQQDGPTRGKRMVFFSKNMATFLGRACGVLFDRDVVEYPKVSEETTSLSLESVDIQRTGSEKALFDLLRTHYENSPGNVEVHLGCVGEQGFFTLQDLRDRPELVSKVCRVIIQNAGKGIDAADLRLLMRGADRQNERARRRLPEAIAALSLSGVGSSFTSQNWTSRTRVVEEGADRGQAVVFDTQRFASSQLDGFRSELTSSKGEADVLPIEITEHLLKITDEVNFLEPVRYGNVAFTSSDGISVLTPAKMTQAGMVFVNGELKYRFPGAVFNFLLPPPRWDDTENDDPLKHVVRTSLPWKHTEERDAKNNQVVSRAPVLRRLGDHLPFVLGKALFEGVPTCGDLGPRFLDRQLCRINSSGGDPEGDAFPESEFLNIYLAQAVAAAKEKYNAECFPQAALDRQCGAWRAAYNGAAAGKNIPSAQVVLETFDTREFREYAGIADFFNGKRSTFTRKDHRENARLQGLVTLSATSLSLQRFLKGCGVRHDSDLEMQWVPFFERNPFGRALSQKAQSAGKGLLVITLAALGATAVTVVGSGASMVREAVRAGAGKTPEDAPDIFRSGESSRSHNFKLVFGDDSEPDYNETRIDIKDILEAFGIGVLALLMTAAGVGVAAIGFVGLGAAQEHLKPRPLTIEERKNRIRQILQSLFYQLDSFLGLGSDAKVFSKLEVRFVDSGEPDSRAYGQVDWSDNSVLIYNQMVTESGTLGDDNKLLEAMTKYIIEFGVSRVPEGALVGVMQRAGEQKISEVMGLPARKFYKPTT